MRHQDLTINHRLESFVYANAAARTGATGFVSGDVGRIAYQSDTGEYWRLTATTPTWISVVVRPQANTQVTAGAPAGTASATFVMAGQGATFTPVSTGRIFVALQTSISNTTASGGMQIQIRYGTGTPPVNGAAAVGNTLGGVAWLGGNANSASLVVPATVLGVVTGLIIGTTYWADMAVLRQGGVGTTGSGGLSWSAVEI